MNSQTHLHPVAFWKLFCLIVLGFCLGGCSSYSQSFNSDPSARTCQVLLRSAQSHVPASVDPVVASCHPERGALPNLRGPIRNLVFEGGGVKGTAYLGALEVLEAHGVLQDVERVAGTSAGAITALLVALGYDVKDIRRIVTEDLDFALLEDGNGIYRNSRRLVSRYGWYRGDYFLCFIERLLADRLGTPDATFADLAAKAKQDSSYRPLWVVGTEVRSGSSRVFSADSHPQMSIAEALRISMSIPFFFAARELDEGDATGLYVDGAVMRSYPVSIFDTDDAADMETLGFHLGASPVEVQPVTNILEFAGQIFLKIIDVQLDALCRTPDDVARTVFIDGSLTETTNFGISPEDQCSLIEIGAQATSDYLTRPAPPERCPDQLLDYLRHVGLR